MTSKSLILMTIAFCFASCLSMGENKPLQEYKLKNGQIMDLTYYDAGATGSNGIRVFRRDTLIRDLKGLDYRQYTIRFSQTNDTTVMLTFSDTSALFKGREFIQVFYLH